MTSVLPADPVALDGFAGLRLSVTDLADAELAGLRVGIVAASPLHVRVLPDVVQRAGRTKLFVTRPVTVLPITTLAGVARHVPVATRAVARLHRWRSVTEKELRRKVTPLADDAPVVLSADFHRAIQHPRCQVVAWPIAGVSAAGVRTADGLEHHLDVLLTA